MQDDNFIILEARILAELKRYDDGEKLLKARIQLREKQQAKPAEPIPCSSNSATCSCTSAPSTAPRSSTPPLSRTIPTIPTSRSS